MQVRSLTRFEGAARKAVFDLKYGRHTDIASVLGPLMAAIVPAKPFTLVPVPLHSSRRRFRGFNQSEVLARSIAKMIGVPVMAGGLARVRKTADQIGLDAVQRRANVAGAFAWRGMNDLEAVVFSARKRSAFSEEDAKHLKAEEGKR